MKILILGATGMLGSMMLRVFAADRSFDVAATGRGADQIARLGADLAERVIGNVDLLEPETFRAVLSQLRPDAVINCVGVVKQLSSANDPLVAIPINSQLPHRLARTCEQAGARFIHISTDCVFDGQRGNYAETDHPNATDLYGRSKLLGEVASAPHITLRTSMIGPELGTNTGLLAWFLSQSGEVRGFRRAIFSGPTTLELCNILRDIVLPRPDLTGLYHVGADAIGKYDLLKIIAQVYRLDTTIKPDDTVAINRSLDSSRFRTTTGYRPPSWSGLIEALHGEIRG